jgi:hypothetical protein
MEEAYPVSAWVSVIGQGTTWASAESAAMNALARAFNTSVAGLTQANQQFSQVLQQTEGKQTIVFDESRSFSQDVATSTNVSGLIGVQTDRYQAQDGGYYVNARMNRSECSARYAGMIRENASVIASLTRQAGAAPGTLDAYTTLNLAHTLALATDNFQAILEVLNPRAVSQKPAYGSAGAVKLLLDSTARSIVFRIQITGDPDSRISRAFAQSFSGRGFRTAASGTYTHLLRVDLRFENVDSGPNQINRYVRYVMTASIENAQRVELFSYSGNDRVGHASESEARQLAYRRIEASINSEGFFKEFDGYLSSLIR